MISTLKLSRQIDAVFMAILAKMFLGGLKRLEDAQ